MSVPWVGRAHTNSGPFQPLGGDSSQGATPGPVGLFLEAYFPEFLWTLVCSPCHLRGKAVSCLPRAAAAHPGWTCGEPRSCPWLQASVLGLLLGGQLRLQSLEAAPPSLWVARL